MHHNGPLVGHPGFLRTHEQILRNYWWPEIIRNIRKYLSGCVICQRTKVINQKKATLLTPLPIPQGVWQDISVDLIGPLPPSKGFDMIHVVIDRLSKMIVIAPTTQGITSAESARLFRNHTFKRFGLPLTIISDRGSQFISNFTKELHKLLDIKGRPSTAYHPQTDGQTERANAGIEQYIRIFCNNRQNDWSDWLATTEFTHNDQINRLTGKTLFELNIGRHPRKHPDLRINTKNEAVHDLVERMRLVTEEAKRSMQQAQDDMK